ncbi:hypothetical protein ACOBV9_18950 (plasmid) [Pseudoalteromonas espejiana]
MLILHFEDLKAMAKASAEKPYTPTAVPAPELIDKITYDEHWTSFQEKTDIFDGKKHLCNCFTLGDIFLSRVVFISEMIKTTLKNCLLVMRFF